MSFRWRVSLFIVLALFIALVVQFILGFFLFRRALSDDLANDLIQFSYLIEQNLIMTSQGLILRQEGVAAVAPYSSYANGRGRVLDAKGSPVLLIGGLFPEETGGWLIQRRELPEGYRLEVAMSYQLHNTALRDYLQVSSLGLPLLIIAFAAAGLWLSLQLLHPLQRLQTTVEEVTSSGDLKARVKVIQGNNELSHLAQSYNSMMTRLEEFFERERSFTRYASHELRNPLTALRLQVDAALDGDIPAIKVLPVLKHELQRLSTILDSLLILSRDELEPNAKIDLALLAKESVARACALSEGKSQSLEYQGPAHVSFKGDKALLGRMLDNLLENALKYSAGHITLKLSQQPNYIKLCVCDEGPGVPPEIIDKLTTPFFRVRAQQVSGVGLGLSVVQHIVKAHSGTLTLRNRTPTGFEATMIFPQGGL